MTRAMERLAITWAASRMTYSGLTARSRSPFLLDVPEDVLETRGGRGFVPLRHDVRAFDADAGYGDGGSGGSGFGDAGGEGEGAADPGRPVLREAAVPFAPGDRVRHPVFGDGRLLACRGTGSEVRVTVDFDAYGEKQLLLTYANLERIR